MDAANGLVLDANILIDAVLGTRVRKIILRFADEATFLCPDVCLSDARRNIPEICRKLGLDGTIALGFLKEVEKTVRIVESGTYAGQEGEARSRIEQRDPDDWPVVAVALTLDLPIWTEDRDFFGCGVATWITNTIEIYLHTITLID